MVIVEWSEQQTCLITRLHAHMHTQTHTFFSLCVSCLQVLTDYFGQYEMTEEAAEAIASRVRDVLQQQQQQPQEEEEEQQAHDEL